MLLLLASPKGTASLHIVFGGHNIPHPDKVGKCGEDAFFADDEQGAFGIADGVGGSARNGIDPGLFSRELLQRCHTCLPLCCGGTGDLHTTPHTGLWVRTDRARTHRHTNSNTDK